MSVEERAFLRSLNRFEEPLKQGYYINNPDDFRRGTAAVIRSFFMYGLKQTLDPMENYIKLMQQIHERWTQFCSCIVLSNSNNKTAVWETLENSQKLQMHYDDQISRHNSDSDIIINIKQEKEKVERITYAILTELENTDFNISKRGISPLLFAINNNLGISTMRGIRQRGGNLLPVEGSVAMTAIVKKSYKSMASVTLGPNKMEGINSRIMDSSADCSGGTALHYLCTTEKDSEHILTSVYIFLRSGANPLVLNDAFLSPRDILEQRFHAFNKYIVDSNIDKAISHLYNAEKSILKSGNYDANDWQEKVRMLIMKNGKGIPDEVTSNIMKKLYVAQSTDMNTQPLY